MGFALVAVRGGYSLEAEAAQGAPREPRREEGDLPVGRGSEHFLPQQAWVWRHTRAGRMGAGPSLWRRAGPVVGSLALGSLQKVKTCSPTCPAGPGGGWNLIKMPSFSITCERRTAGYNLEPRVGRPRFGAVPPLSVTSGRDS